MGISILTARRLLRSVPKSWAAQYKDYRGWEQQEKIEITEKLFALKWPFSKQEVDSIIGNPSWTRLKCGCCDEVTDAVAIIADFYSDTPKISLCLNCLTEAAGKIRRAAK